MQLCDPSLYMQDPTLIWNDDIYTLGHMLEFLHLLHIDAFSVANV